MNILEYGTIECPSISNVIPQQYPIVFKVRGWKKPELVFFLNRYSGIKDRSRWVAIRKKMLKIGFRAKLIASLERAHSLQAVLESASCP